MKRRPLPQTPQELLEQLVEIFPDFRAEHARYEDPEWPWEPTFHSVLLEFRSFFGAASSEKQLRRLGELVSEAVEGGGLLENAFTTAFLEHSRRSAAHRALRPYLSKKLRGKK